MSIRIVDNKKLEMTDDEYSEYIKICRSYDRKFFRGDDLFKDLFESNDDGVIIYIKSITNKQFTFEVMFFMMNLMQNQWLRLMTKQVNQTLAAVNKKMIEVEKKLAELNAASSNNTAK